MTVKKGIRAVQWQTPETRQMPIWEHAVTCSYCGRQFVAELTTPIAPLYCSKKDNPDCYRGRKAAYMAQYREGKTDEK